MSEPDDIEVDSSYDSEERYIDFEKINCVQNILSIFNQYLINV